MSPDPLEQLRITDGPATPDHRFVAGLRNRLVAALDAAFVPTIDLPERNPVVTDTATTTTNTSTTTSGNTAAVTSTLTPYLAVRGGPGAIDWYVEVLGATELVRYTADDGRIGHAELSIGGATFMLSDEYPELGVPVVAPTSLGGTPFSMHLTVPDVDAVYGRVVAAGDAAVGREPRDEAYGARSFDMIDPFGHRWMIQTPIASPSKDEIEAQMPGYTIEDRAGVFSTKAAPVEIGYATFATPDTARAVRFYGALFGWSTEPGNMGDQYAHVDNTKLPMGITPGRADESPVIYYRVDDVAAYASRVRELGGEVIDETTYASGPSATCRDDQGREFQLWQPGPGYE